MSEEKEEELKPLEVTVVNKDKKEVSDYDSVDDMEYDDLGIKEEQIKEFENGDTSSN